MSGPSKNYESVNTDELSTVSKPTAGVVWKESGTTYGLVQATGQQYSDADPAVVINNLISDIKSEHGGGTIELGPYNFTSVASAGTPIQLRGHVVLKGQGIGGADSDNVTQLTLASGADTNVVEWKPTSTEFFAGLENMRITGQSSNNTGGHCLHTADTNGGNPKDMHCENVWFHDAADDGAHLNSNWGYKFTDCLFEGCAKNGLYADDAQLYVSGFYAALNGTNGMELGSNATDVKLFGRMNDNGRRGIYSAGNRMNAVLTVTNNAWDGIELAGANNSRIAAVLNNNSKGNTGSYPNLDLNAFNCYLSLMEGAGPDVSNGIVFSGTKNVVNGRLSGSIAYNSNTEHLNVINGRGINSGDPNSTGAWNGNASFADVHGAVVWDTSTATDTPYRAAPDGSWVAI